MQYQIDSLLSHI